MHPVSDSETGAASSIKYQRVHNVEFQGEKLHILPSKRLLLPSKRLLCIENRGAKNSDFGPGFMSYFQVNGYVCIPAVIRGAIHEGHLVAYGFKHIRIYRRFFSLWFMLFRI